MCNIKYLQYRIWHVLHEIDSLKSTTNQRRYQELSAFLLPCSSSEDSLERADSSTFQQSSGRNLARSSLIRACSSSTSSISLTDPASPGLRNSLSQCLLKCEL